MEGTGEAAHLERHRVDVGHRVHPAVGRVDDGQRCVQPDWRAKRGTEAENRSVLKSSPLTPLLAAIVPLKNVRLRITNLVSITGGKLAGRCRGQRAARLSPARRQASCGGGC